MKGPAILHASFSQAFAAFLSGAIKRRFIGNARWLHEAVAGRFEQTRDHYGDAARLSRKVVAGEYFRMGDLFEQKVVEGVERPPRRRAHGPHG